jgi:hypothetical protein
MSEAPEILARKADACRRLADLVDDAERRMLWIERATEWERLAAREDTKSARH